MNSPPTLYTQHRGAWCDNCRTAFCYMPTDRRCPYCNAAGPARPSAVELRPATITVEPDEPASTERGEDR